MRRPPQSQRNAKILLILDKCGPGEAVRTAPMLGAVRAAYPSAKIDLLVGEQAHPLFAHDARFDTVVLSALYGRRRGRLPRLRAALTACAIVAQLGFGYDLVITYLWGSSWLNLIARTVGARRIGYSHRFPGLVTSSLGAYGPDGDRPANLRLLKAAGIPLPNLESPPDLVLEKEVVDAASRLLVARGRRPSRPLVVMHTGSDWACQQWLPDRWAELADRVADEYGADVVFTGLASELGYVEQIRARMRTSSLSIAGETSLPQLAAVISLASICVTVDSVAHDMAQAMRVPTLVLAGPSRPEAAAGARLRVINGSTSELQRTIVSCQDQFPAGFCHDYSCPLTGLRHISVEAVAKEIAVTGSLAGSGAEASIKGRHWQGAGRRN
jgi:ADP-heptose:LPS heptosyltransferase